MKDILNALTGTESENANVLAINIFYVAIVIITFIVAIK